MSSWKLWVASALVASAAWHWLALPDTIAQVIDSVHHVICMVTSLTMYHTNIWYASTCPFTLIKLIEYRECPYSLDHAIMSKNCFKTWNYFVKIAVWKKKDFQESSFLLCMLCHSSGPLDHFLYRMCHKNYAYCILVVVWYWPVLPIPFWVASLVVDQSHMIAPVIGSITALYVTMVICYNGNLFISQRICSLFTGGFLRSGGINQFTDGHLWWWIMLLVQLFIVTTVYLGLVQDCGISSANALEIPQSCTKPMIWSLFLVSLWMSGGIIQLAAGTPWWWMFLIGQLNLS